MNKKAISILLCFGMCITMLAGCNQKDSSKETEEQSSKDVKRQHLGGFRQIKRVSYLVMIMMYGQKSVKEQGIRLNIRSWNGMGCGLCLMMEDWIP